MELFDNHWATYRRIVDADLMEHRGATATVTHQLADAVRRKRRGGARLHLVDLGCGDLALLAPTLRVLPLASFTGVDLSPAVLALAERALDGADFPRRWLSGHLLDWAEGRLAGDDGASVDVLHSALAVHHLRDDEKARFLAAARRRMAPGGLFLWTDLFRRPGESREQYVARYEQRVRGWTPLDDAERQRVVDHVRELDHPADRDAIVPVARGAGWRCTWAWKGSHDAEAVLVLEAA